jgi:hypothetical protein
MKSNDLAVITIQELIDFHQAAVDGCDAYAMIDNSDKQTAKHYAKRSVWHKAAVDLLSLQFTAVDLATAAADGFKDGRASVVVELPRRLVDWSTDNFADGYNLALLRAAKAIIAAGGSIKE